VQVGEYDLFIDLDFDRLEYSGRLLIRLQTEQNVVLNAVGLNIHRIRSGERDLHFSQQGEDLIVHTGAFAGSFEVEYSAVVPDSLAGIYRAPYSNTHIVTTHFEAAQARRMFPCVDRPDIKAEFKLTVRIDKDLTAISNMPVEFTKQNGEKKTVAFQKSPRMSTYLLYLGVGKFEESTQRMDGTDIIVATTPGKTRYGGFAQKEARNAIRYFNSYYGIPYTLPKLHLIGVPEFAMGAMENWGAITFRETRLLVQPSTSTKTKMQISLAVAHELAHQWFGDLVTMKWWDDIWLNESFATLMAYKAVDSMHPDWNIRNNFFNGEPKVETLVGALSRDCMKSTHPIQVPVNSPDEIEQIFDAISYGKGAHVLEMIEAYIGEEAFRQGVQRYLSEHAYSNASSGDLWSALERASGKPVVRIMTSWITQPGYPNLTLSLRDGRLHLSQSRFLLSSHSEKVTWPIPLIIEINGKRENVLMEGSEEAIDVGVIDSLRVNPDRPGFYSVYSPGLDDLVWRSKLSPYDRWGIAFDAFNLLLAEKITFDEYMTKLKRFDNETDPLPAQEVSDQFDRLWMLVPAAAAAPSRAFHRTLITALEKNTDENSSILHGTVAARLVLVDHEYASDLAEDFKRYKTIAPEMRSAVAIAYARTTKDFQGLVNAFRESESDEEKDRFLGAMSNLPDETLVQQTIDLALSGEVKRQDVIFVIASCARNPQAKDITWNCIRSNLGKLQALYQSTGLLSSILLAIIPFLGVGRVQEVEEFFRTHPVPDADVGIKAGLERLWAYDRLVRRVMQPSR